jgi:hypothetical protein
MKAVALVVAFALLGSCSFSQKHPGVTVGVVAGVVGFGACGLAVEKLDTCSLIGGIAGLALGGITGLVTTFADTSAHELDLEDEDETGVVRSGTPPPPGLPPGMQQPLPDAGVGSAATDAGVPSDAGSGQLDATP